MNGTTRDELLAVFAELGERLPTMRLGQLIAHVAADIAETPYRNPVVDIEDDELLAAAREYMGRLSPAAALAAG